RGRRLTRAKWLGGSTRPACASTSWPPGREVEHIRWRLELEAHAHRRGDVGGAEIVTGGEGVPDAAVHHADIAVETLGQAIVGVERDHVLIAATGSGLGGMGLVQGTFGIGGGAAVLVLLITI